MDAIPTALVAWPQLFKNFVLRHRWSLPLGLLSSAFFLQLAWEVREEELAAFDRAVASWFAGTRGALDTPMLAFTHTGGGWGMTILCVTAVLLFERFNQRRAALFAAVCGTGAWALSVSLKLAFQRARPDVSVLYMIEVPSSFSFPSGHALGSTGVVGCLAVLAHALRLPFAWRIAATAVASTYIAGVAASRVYFGVHYASDVLGGVLAGAAWIAAVTGLFYPRLLPGEAAKGSESGSSRRPH